MANSDLQKSQTMAHPNPAKRAAFLNHTLSNPMQLSTTFTDAHLQPL